MSCPPIPANPLRVAESCLSVAASGLLPWIPSLSIGFRDRAIAVWTALTRCSTCQSLALIPQDPSSELHAA